MELFLLLTGILLILLAVIIKPASRNKGQTVDLEQWRRGFNSGKNNERQRIEFLRNELGAYDPEAKVEYATLAYLADAMAAGHGFSPNMLLLQTKRVKTVLEQKLSDQVDVPLLYKEHAEAPMFPNWSKSKKPKKRKASKRGGKQ